MQGFSVLNIFLLVLGGSLAGFINTLAGGGSHVTVTKGNAFIQKFVVAMVILSAILLLVK